MMIYRCDRCGKLMNKPSAEIRVKGEFNILLETDVVIPSMHICEDCTKAFEQFRQGIATKGVTKEEY